MRSHETSSPHLGSTPVNFLYLNDSEIRSQDQRRRPSGESPVRPGRVTRDSTPEVVGARGTLG